MAVHAITGQKVALKIINRKKIATMEMGGRVKREIQYLKLLRHPHIIKLYVFIFYLFLLYLFINYIRYEVITTPTDIIMVIEYAGRELFNYIVEKGRVKLKKKKKIWMTN